MQKNVKYSKVWAAMSFELRWLFVAFDLDQGYTDGLKIARRKKIEGTMFSRLRYLLLVPETLKTSLQPCPRTHKFCVHLERERKGELAFWMWKK